MPSAATATHPRASSAFGSSLGPNRVGKVPRPKVKDLLPAVNPFSTPYQSVWLKNLAKSKANEHIVDCLDHVNCSYLSGGIGPNLEQLKQHAQSLAVLIRELTLSTLPNLVEAGTSGDFHADESFDWLNDLQNPYSSKQGHHQQPLTGIINILESVNGVTRKRCPLHEVQSHDPMVQNNPFATHANLIRHTDELLERLDHEYSAKGGLLSIFPTDIQKEDREKAEKTVLGQMIFFTQNLIQRVHHLERLYANSLDLLAEEAVVPTETLSALGTKGRRSRPVVYPQDRFVLSNAGEDVWNFLNTEFEKKEVIDTQIEEMHRRNGTAGAAIWQEEGGKEFAQGITAIDVVTRYYRHRKHDLKTIFVIPAYESHPGVRVTREIQSQPTVVSVVKPVYPERASVLSARYKSELRELENLRIEVMNLRRTTEEQQQTNDILTSERERLKQRERELEREVKQAVTVMNNSAGENKMAILMELGQYSSQKLKYTNEATRLRKQRETENAAVETVKQQAEKAIQDRAEGRRKLKEQEDQNQRRYEEKMRSAHDWDADVAHAAQATGKLKDIWLKQIAETEIVSEYLAAGAVPLELEEGVIPPTIVSQATEAAKARFDSVAATIPSTVPKRGFMDISSSEEDEQVPLAQAPTTATWRAQAQGRNSVVGSSRFQPPASKRAPAYNPGAPSVTGDSTRTFPGSPTDDPFVTRSSHGRKKSVTISATELGPTGSEPPSKKTRTGSSSTGKSPQKSSFRRPSMPNIENTTVEETQRRLREAREEEEREDREAIEEQMRMMDEQTEQFRNMNGEDDEDMEIAANDPADVEGDDMGEGTSYLGSSASNDAYENLEDDPEEWWEA